MSYKFLVLAMPMAMLASPQDTLAHGLAEVRSAIARQSPELSIEHLNPSPVPGLFHVVLGGTSGYVTRDGRYFFSGDLLDVQQRKNVTEDIRKTQRLQLLASIRAQDRIVFSPAKPQHVVTVFTDVDCAYCRKLHSQIDQYNKLGIGVQYVAFPRSGPGSESWDKMDAVWCAKDRGELLTRAKNGDSIAEKPSDCASTPVGAQFALGEKLGVAGTPTIILEDGSLIGGYVPPEQLAGALQRQASTATHD